MFQPLTVSAFLKMRVGLTAPQQPHHGHWSERPSACWAAVGALPRTLSPGTETGVKGGAARVVRRLKMALPSVLARARQGQGAR